MREFRTQYGVQVHFYATEIENTCYREAFPATHGKVGDLRPARKTCLQYLNNCCGSAVLKVKTTF